MLHPINLRALKDYLLEHVEPLEHPVFGKRFRASVRLIDDTVLPCVVFQNRKDQVDLAIRRLEKLAKNPDQYRMIVENFSFRGSRLAESEIASVEHSLYAWPSAVVKQIRGETTMGWTSFVVEMKDGTLHSFGTTFSFEFFDLPRGYSHDDIKSIHSGMVYSASRGLTDYSLDALKAAQVYRERPFFTCYLDDLI